MDTTNQSVAGSDLQGDRLGLLKSRLKVAKAFVEKPYKQMKKYIAEYELEDIENIDEIRDKVRIGHIFRRVESDLPAVFDDQPELYIKGKGKYRDFDPYFANCYDWLWDIQNLDEKIDDAGAMFILLGMCYVGTPWETKTKQVPDPKTGQMFTVPTSDQPQAVVKNIFKIFPSPETEFSHLLDTDHCPYIFEEHSMSKEKIKAKFNKDVDPSEILHTDNTDVDAELSTIKDSTGTLKDDIKRSKVYEFYGILPEEMTKDIEGEGWSYDKEYHIFFTDNEELQVEECQYDNKPIVLLGNYGLITKFMRFGEAKHLVPLVQEYEQYRSQILKHTRKMANPKALIPTTTDVNLKDFNDPNVGKEVLYTPGDRGEKPEYMQPPQLGGEVTTGVELVKTDLEQQGGSFQLEGGSNQSTVKTPRGIQVFSEASDRNTRRKRKKIARFIRTLILFQFKLCSTNFDPQDPKVVEIFFGDEQPRVDITLILKVLGDDNILAKVQIEIESLSINRAQIKQDALDLLDTAIKSEQAHPGLVNLQEIWKDVIQNAFGKRDADRYLTSLDQIKAQAIQEFIGQVGQVSPELGGQIAQLIQSPNMSQMQSQNQQNQIKESMNFKDLPPQGQIQMAKQAGINLSANSVAQAPQVPQVAGGGGPNG